jgi:hypothetical protein
MLAAMALTQRDLQFAGFRMVEAQMENQFPSASTLIWYGFDDSTSGS